MFHRFWQSLLNKVFLFFILCFVTKSHAQSEVPGLFESLDVLIQVDQKNQRKQTEIPLFDRRILQGQIFLEEKQLNSILFNLPRNLTTLGQDNPCSLIHLMNINQLGVDHILFFDRNENQLKRVGSDKIVHHYLNGICSTQRALDKKLNVRNQSAMAQIRNTLIPIPKHIDQCYQLHKALGENPESTYFCGYVHQVERFQQIAQESGQVSQNINQIRSTNLRAQKIIDFMGKNNFKDYQIFCRNTDQPRKFCDQIMNARFFERMAKNSLTLPFVKSQCSNLQTKSHSTGYSTEKAMNCIQAMNSKPELCLFHNPSYSSYFPKEICPSLEENLNLSRLPILSYDCPGKVENDLAIQASRILSFFEPDKYNYQWGSKDLSCTQALTVPYIDFASKIDQEQGWGTQACYKNPKKGSRRCQPIVFHNHSSKNSFRSFIEKTLKDFQTKGNVECQLIAKELFDPKRLEYQSGCYILIEPSCNANQCPFEIKFNNRSLDPLVDVQFEPKGWYSGLSEKTSNFSFEQSLIRQLKLSSQSIKNAKQAKKFLEENPNGIIHGIACAEELYPQNYRRQGFSQCRPLPILITGRDRKVTNQNENIFVVQSVIDSNSSPRLMDWSYIHNAVHLYHQIHPQKKWSLNGISR